MRKIQILGAAFFAVLVFSVVAAAGASAAPKWLLDGMNITTPAHVTVEGKWLIRALIPLFNPTHIACSGVLLGTVGPGAADEVTKVFGLGGEAETKINCEVLMTELGVCSGSLLALVTAEHLNWPTELLLPAGTTEIVDHFKAGANGKPAFDVECTLANGMKFLELCEGIILTKGLINLPEHMDVDGSILNSLSEKCNNANVVAHIEAEGLIRELGKELSVSD